MTACISRLDHLGSLFGDWITWVRCLAAAPSSAALRVFAAAPSSTTRAAAIASTSALTLATYASTSALLMPSDGTTCGVVWVGRSNPRDLEPMDVQKKGCFWNSSEDELWVLGNG